MKKRILVFIIGLLTHSAASANEYFTLTEYHQHHPDQSLLSAEFADAVRNPAVSIAEPFKNKKVSISFIYPGEQFSDYWRRSVLSFKKRMDQIGIQYKINEYFSKPFKDHRVQEQQLRMALKNNPDYLVFTLDAQKHRRMIERIITRRRPKLILQNITTPLKQWENKQPFLYVGFDHVKGAEMLADYFIQKTGGSGRYAVLFFTRGHVSDLRGGAFIRYLKKHSELEMTASFYTDGSRKKSRKAALEIIKLFPDISFIYACATDVALGAIDALKEAAQKNRHIMINGWGGGSEELTAIVEGKMDVTVMRMNDDNGAAMAEAIRLDAEMKPERVPVVFSGDYTIVEKGITLKELEHLKKRAFRLSGGD